MTNYLDRAERAYDHGASDDRASALALIAIAQQLRIMNLIKMNKVVVREGTRIGPSYYLPNKDKPDHLRPDVAEALGIPEEK